jgi:hypothetical protein
MKKLDRVLVTREWESLFPNVWVYKLPKDMSDRNPLVVDILNHQRVGRNNEFRFELSCLKQQDFLEMVEKIWKVPTRDSIPLDRVIFKLKKVKESLKGWGFNLSGNKKQRMKEIHEEIGTLGLLEEQGSINDDQIRKKVALNVELLHILDEEELYWYRRCHETRLLKGDNNTSFFHKISSGQRRKQSIFSLQDGCTTIKANCLLDHATQYYKNLFWPGGGNAFELSPGLWPAEACVNDQENVEMTRPFSEEEIKHALFQMDKNKATGFPIEFF